jgi:DNA-binding transcriptional ArsR family regulator
MESKPQSKPLSQKGLLRYRILKRVQKGMYASQIARQMNMSRQAVGKSLKRSLALGLIKLEFRSSFKHYIITDKGKEFLIQVNLSSLPMADKKTRLHNLTMKFPIKTDNPDAKWDSDTENKGQLNNWIRKYSKIVFPIGMTVQKNPDNIIVHFHQFDSTQKMFLTDFFSWILKGVWYVEGWLLKEQGIEIDRFEGKIIREHLANESPEYNESIDKKKTVEMKLGRDAKNILPTDFQASAWLDKSKGNVDVETNDMIYEEKLLMMPETMFEMERKQDFIMRNFETFSRNQQSHIAAIKGIEQGSIEIAESQRELTKAVRELRKAVKEMNKK